MIVSISQPAQVPAKSTSTKPHASKPRVHVSRRRDKLVMALSTASKKPEVPARRPGTKTSKILRLLGRSGGASLAELKKATGWQAHSVRGFLSGAVKGKMCLKLSVIKRDDGERAYRIAPK